MAKPRSAWFADTGKENFQEITENSFDLKMRTITIAGNWSRDWLDKLKALRSDSQIISSSG